MACGRSFSSLDLRQEAARNDDGLSIARSRSASADDGPSERRASFQKTALLRRLHQKKTFDILKQVARTVESPRSKEKRRSLDDILGIHGRRKSPSPATKKTAKRYSQKNALAASKIQALFRGFQCRATSIISLRKKELTKRQFINHRRQCSELTMSDWNNDSFRSLGSLENSPRTNMIMNEESCQKCCMNTSSATTISMTENEDSFSSIFSVESYDYPIRRPRRKLTPTPSFDGPGGGMTAPCSPDRYFPPMTPDTSVKKKMDDGRNLSPMSPLSSLSRGDSGCRLSPSRQSWPIPRPPLSSTPDGIERKYFPLMTPNDDTSRKENVDHEDDDSLKYSLHEVISGPPLTSSFSEDELTSKRIDVVCHSSMNTLWVSKSCGSTDDNGACNKTRSICGNASFSSYFAKRDEPVKAPQRSLSPTFARRKRSSLSQIGD